MPSTLIVNIFIFTVVLLLVLQTSSVSADHDHSHNSLPFSCTDFSQLKPDQRIICENTLPGNPTSEWDINAHGDPSIQGFSTDISFHVGTTASFKINTSEEVESYRVDIFRMGYYNGLGARKVATIQPTSVTLPFLQPPCRLDPDTYEFSCRDWKVTATWDIPADAASGVYIARPVRTDNKPPNTWRADNSQKDEDPMFVMPGQGRHVRPKPGPHKWGANGFGKMKNPIKEPQASHIYFVVRDDSAKTDIIFQTADTVWQAYNGEGGASTYATFAEGVKHRCYKASYDRPLRTRGIRPINTFLASEFPMIQFLEKHGYSVSYISGVDTDRLGYERLLQHKLFLSVGHDEYWSGRQRANLEAAQEKGGLHIAFLAGNEMFWRIRWEDNYRTMVVFKETQHPTKLDPNATEWTGTWRDARPINPVGPKPENAIIGQQFTMNAWRNDPLIVPKRFASLKWWKNTQVEDLLKDTTGRKKFVAYFRGVLGHEMDEDIDNGFRPPGVIHLSETHVENTQFMVDYGSTYDSGHGIHRMTLYRHRYSNSIVWGFGSCQLSWALAPLHDEVEQIPSYIVNSYNTRVGFDILSPVRDLQQFVVNVFAEMDGVIPFFYSPSSSSSSSLPSWYREALEYGETFIIPSRKEQQEQEKDTTPPTCKIINVHIPSSPTKRKQMFVDSPNGEPEPFATITLEANDNIGGGVVAGAEVSIDNKRWHFALPIEEQTDTPLRREGSKWVVDVALRGMDEDIDEMSSVDQQESFVKKIAKCRATDDSLNTNYDYEEEGLNVGGGDL